mmetsp:Transcript_15420/g.47716  ORF Transcript_15420/g.47716 Transcript_15420/m.47716 type:complete len:290 (+) Transcript_15420:6221-7090(+)
MLKFRVAASVLNGAVGTTEALMDSPALHCPKMSGVPAATVYVRRPPSYSSVGDGKRLTVDVVFTSTGNVSDVDAYSAAIADANGRLKSRRHHARPWTTGFKSSVMFGAAAVISSVVIAGPLLVLFTRNSAKNVQLDSVRSNPVALVFEYTFPGGGTCSCSWYVSSGAPMCMYAPGACAVICSSGATTKTMRFNVSGPKEVGASIVRFTSTVVGAVTLLNAVMFAHVSVICGAVGRNTVGVVMSTKPAGEAVSCIVTFSAASSCVGSVQMRSAWTAFGRSTLIDPPMRST